MANPVVDAAIVSLLPFSVIFLLLAFRRGSRSWARLAKSYGSQVDLDECHSQDGIQIGIGRKITEGEVKVGATQKGLVLKPLGMATVEIPWDKLRIEDHQGEWFAHVKVATGEVPGLGIRRHIFDSILKALEGNEALDHLRPSS